MNKENRIDSTFEITMFHNNNKLQNEAENCTVLFTVLRHYVYEIGFTKFSPNSDLQTANIYCHNTNFPKLKHF